MPKDPENVVRMARHRAFNPDTGEVFDLEMAAQRGRRRRGKRKMFALVDLDSLVMLELTGGEWSVLHRIMRGVNPETNEARVSQAEIANDVGMAQPNVSRIMKALRERQIIFTVRDGVHRVNAHIMYRGSNQDWDTATDTEIEPVWTRS